ncbi:MAG: hypothetical protein GY804_02520 [Alphaproteobacteria bacterium]|nr:hypothetical protein [Alphaproteobacteria bacterium]
MMNMTVTISFDDLKLTRKEVLEKIATTELDCVVVEDYHALEVEIQSLRNMINGVELERFKKY